LVELAGEGAFASISDQRDIDLNLEFTASVKSLSKLTEISHPKDCQILKNTDNEVQFQMKNFKLQDLEKDIHIFFRSAELNDFKFYY